MRLLHESVGLRLVAAYSLGPWRERSRSWRLREGRCVSASGAFEGSARTSRAGVSAKSAATQSILQHFADEAALHVGALGEQRRELGGIVEVLGFASQSQSPSLRNVLRIRPVCESDARSNGSKDSRAGRTRYGTPSGGAVVCAKRSRSVKLLGIEFAVWRRSERTEPRSRRTDAAPSPSMNDSRTLRAASGSGSRAR